MTTIPDLLSAALARALPQLSQPPPADFPAQVQAAADTRFGDYQTNAAMLLAKTARTNPRALAEELTAKLAEDDELGEISLPPTVAGPGFVNFTVRPEFLAARVPELLADDRLGVPVAAPKHKVVIDFSSPNIAKPMHVGHLRSTLLGDCLGRVARFVGHEVISDNHLGDWGTQFGKVIRGWKLHRDPAALAADPLAELVRIYQLADAETKTNPAAADDCRAELAKLQAGDEENVGIWKECVRLSREELDRIYARLGITFDHTLGESFYNDRLASVTERLVAQGIARESEGAIVAFFDEPKLADRPSIIRKRDGAYNYTTTDVATFELRVHEWGADAMWCVVGAPQALHFEQLNALARRLGITVPITHIQFGSILGADGRIMRTREGESVALRDLLDEAEERAAAVIAERSPDLPPDERASVARIIGLGAVKYADLSQHRLTDYKFLWEKMLSFQGNTAPYLQNAYVRIRSIFRRSGEEAPAAPPALTLSAPEEIALARRLAQFAEAVPAVLDDFRPNLLANYLFELANAFHAFYEACPVLKAEGTARASRLLLCETTARVLKTGLGLLGIEAPERM